MGIKEYNAGSQLIAYKIDMIRQCFQSVYYSFIKKAIVIRLVIQCLIIRIDEVFSGFYKNKEDTGLDIIRQQK